jgi:hypothetical protein
VTLGHQQQRVDHAAGHEAEVAAADGEVERGEGVERAVEEASRGDLEPALRVFGAPHGVDDVVSLAGLVHERRDDLGRMLEVGVHRDDEVAGRCGEAGGQGDLVPEVPRQPDPPEALVVTGRGFDRLPGGVGRAVVDDDDLPLRRQVLEDPGQAPEQLRNRLLLVARGDDDAHLHGADSGRRK